MLLQITLYQSVSKKKDYIIQQYLLNHITNCAILHSKHSHFGRGNDAKRNTICPILHEAIIPN